MSDCKKCASSLPLDQTPNSYTWEDKEASSTGPHCRQSFQDQGLDTDNHKGVAEPEARALAAPSQLMRGTHIQVAEAPTPAPLQGGINEPHFLMRPLRLREAPSLAQKANAKAVTGPAPDSQRHAPGPHWTQRSSWKVGGAGPVPGIAA